MSNDVKINIAATDNASAAIDQINKHLAGLSQNVAGMASTFTKLSGIGIAFGAGIAAAKGIGQVFESFSGAIGDFDQGVESVNALGRAMQQNAGYSADLLSAHKAMADQLQESTNIEAERILGLMRDASMMGVASDQVDDMANAAIGLSNAMGIDLDDAMKKVRLAQEGHFESFRKTIPSLKDMATNEERLAAVMKLADKGMEDQIAKSDSAQQSGVRMSLAIGELMESIGALLSPLRQVAAQGMTALANAINNTIAPTIDRIIGGFMAMGPILDVVGQAFNSLGVVAGVYIEAIAGAWGGLISSFIGAGTTVESVAQGISIAVKWLSEQAIAALTFMEVGIANAGEVWQLLKAKATLNLVSMGEEIKYTFTTVIPAYGAWFGENWLRIISDAFNATVTAASNFGTMLTEVFTTFMTRDMELLAWFGDNWQNLFIDAGSAVVTIIQNWGKLAAEVYGSIWKYLAGDMSGGLDELTAKLNGTIGRNLLEGFEATTKAMPNVLEGLGDELGQALSRNLLDGFESQTSALPEIASRALTAQETELQSQIAAIGADLGGKFSEKYKERIAKLNADTSDMLKPKIELGMDVNTKELDKAKKGGKSSFDVELKAMESRLLTRGTPQGPIDDIKKNTAESTAALERIEKLMTKEAQDTNDALEVELVG